ncbi:MAG TPA: hemolysin family protein [Elusimicrobiota bacterium]|nr:hemolysin family protein [Elusimicrobiota bacterium]
MTASWLELSAVGLFVLLSMAFSASETALLSLSRPRLKKLISQRPSLAPAFTEWLSSPQYLLTTLLVGNTLCNVLATILMTRLALVTFVRPSHTRVESAVWLGMTAVLFLVGDFLPKSLARHYPQRVALATLRWVSALTRLLTPAIRFGLGFLETLFPSFAGVPVGKLTVYSVEDLREMIRTSAVQGGTPHRSMQMMERALALHKIPVSQIMTPFAKMEAVNLGVDSEQILDQVAEAGRTRVPAYRLNRRKIGGYLHVKDLLLVWQGMLPLNFDLLLRQPLYVSADRTANDLLEEFRKGSSHLAIVNTPDGDCLGLATLEDVLEEVVGEILDETDLENPRGVH